MKFGVIILPTIACLPATATTASIAPLPKHRLEKFRKIIIATAAKSFIIKTTTACAAGITLLLAGLLLLGLLISLAVLPVFAVFIVFFAFFGVA
jgi:hypothetical protein